VTDVVLYASMSGNAEWLALEIARARSIPSVHADLARVPELARAGRVLAVMPTWGRGELPLDASPLVRALAAAPGALAGVAFAVVALGDRRYPDFCGGGLTFARLLVAAGASELAPPLLLDGAPAERHWGEVERWLARVW